MCLELLQAAAEKQREGDSDGEGKEKSVGPLARMRLSGRSCQHVDMPRI